MVAELLLSRLAQPLISLVGRAAGVDLGVLSDATSIADSLGSNSLEKRRMRRRIEDVADIVAERLEGLIASEFRQMPENEQEAAVLALGAAIERQDIASIDQLLEVVRDPYAFSQKVLDDGGRDLRAGLRSTAGSALFDRLLDESSAYLTELALTLPEFTPAALAALLREQERFVRQVTLGLDHLTTHRLHTDGRDREGADFLKYYRQSIARRYDYLEILGIDLEHALKRYQLSTAYVSLNISPDAANGRPSQTSGERSVEDLLRDAPRLLLVGEPGAGKSTILKWIAVAAARGSFQGDLHEWNRKVPFLIKLRSVDPSDIGDLERMTGDAGLSAKALVPDGWAHTVLGSGHAVILFDGLDEVDHQTRLRIYQWIDDISELYPDVAIVVTTRPAAMRETPFTPGGFRSGYVLPMSLRQVGDFIDYWHESVFADAAGGDDELGPQERAEALRARLFRDRELRLIATSPLLCAVICALNVARRGALPSRRHEVYEQTLQMLLKRREDERSLETSPLSAQEKSAILQELAQWLTLMGRSQISVDDAEALTGNVVRYFGRALGAKEVLQNLIARSGLLRHPAPDAIEFTHKTFQEFLAAQKIVEDRQHPELSRHALDADWQQVVAWSVGFMARTDADSFVDSLLDGISGSDGEDERTRLILLALNCRESALFLSPDRRQTIAELGVEVVPPQSFDTVAALASAGDAAVGLVAATMTAMQDQVALELSCETLVRIAGPEALAALASLPPSILERLARQLIAGWASFEAEVYAKNVLARVPGRLSESAAIPVLLRDAKLLPHVPIVQGAFAVSAEVSEKALARVGYPAVQLRTLKLDSPPPGWSLDLLGDMRVDTVILTGATRITFPGDDEVEARGERLMRRLRIEAAVTGCEVDAFTGCPGSDSDQVEEVELVGDFDVGKDGPRLYGVESLRVGDATGETWRHGWRTDAKVIEVRGWRGHDLAPIGAGAHAVEELHVPDSETLASLSGVELLESLVTLNVSGCEELADADALRLSSSIEVVDLSGCRALADRALISGLQQDIEFVVEGSGVSAGEDVEVEILLEEERWDSVDLDRQEADEIRKRHWSFLEFEMEEYVEEFGDLWMEPVEFSDADAAERGFIIVESLETWEAEVDPEPS